MPDVDISELLERIERTEVAIFCGAGISRKSGIPIVRDINSHLLQRLGETSETVDLVLNSSLPFEAFMEALDEGREISRLLGIFSGGEANANHQLIAYLAKAGLVRTIITTNFDLLIEQALQAAGLPEGSGFVKYSDRGKFGEIDWSRRATRLIKLHGSLEHPDEIAVTLRQVAGKVWTTGTQSTIERTFSSGDHQAVLILGYSCSDLFDLSPQIEALDGPQKQVWLVDHETGEPSAEDLSTKTLKNPFRRWQNGRRLRVNTDWIVARIREACVPDAPDPRGALAAPNWSAVVDAWAPDVQTPGGQAEAEYLLGTVLVRISSFGLARQHFQRGLDQAGDEKLRGRCHVGLAIAAEQLADFDAMRSHASAAVDLGTRIGDANLVRTAKMALGSAHLTRSEFKDAEPWIREAAPDEKEALSSPGLAMSALNNLGLVRLGLGQFSEALAAFENAAKLCADLGDKRGEGNVWTNIGNVHSTRGDNHAALEAHQKALEIYRSIGDRWGEIAALDHIGVAQKNLGDYAAAFAGYDASLKLAGEMDDTRGLMFAHASLALACQDQGRTQEALQHAEQAIALSDQVHDEKSQAGVLLNLAQAYVRLGQLDRADETMQRGRAIAERLGDAALVTSFLGIEANYWSARGDLPRAYELQTQVFERAKKAGLKKAMAVSLQNIGSLLSDLGQLQDAFDSTTAALQLAEEIGDGNTQALAQNGLGVIQKRAGNYPAAIEMYEAGLEVARRIGNRDSERTCLGNLAIAYGKLGRFREMEETANQALAIARETGNRSSEGNHLGTLGNAYAATNQPERALQAYKDALASFRAAGSRRDEAMALDNIASTLANQGRFQESLDWFAQARDVAVTVYAPDENFMRALAQKIEAARRAATGSDSPPPQRPKTRKGRPPTR